MCKNEYKHFRIIKAYRSNTTEFQQEIKVITVTVEELIEVANALDVDFE